MKQTPDSSPFNPLTKEKRDYLEQVTIGKRLPLHNTVYLSPYDPGWIDEYESIARKIRNALGSRALQIEHVGSTSVPGIMAKPIIDVLLIVANPAKEATYIPQLEEEGFVLKIREPHWYAHRVLNLHGKNCNLHVFAPDCEEANRMIVFRNRLRTHPEDLQLYEKTKKELAAQRWEDLQGYADAKSAVIRKILNQAGLS